MPRVTGTVTIDRPTDEVFGALADLRNTAAWDPPVRRVALLGPEVGLGAEFEAHMVGAGVTRLTITRYEPPNGLAFDATNRLAQVHDDIAITTVSDRCCRVDVEATLTLAGRLAHVDVLARPLGAAMGRLSTRRLKRWLESRPEEGEDHDDH